MRQLRTITFLLVLISAGAAAAAAQNPPDKVFEMPGVFRIALPQGWQRSRVINDRYTVAAFSSKNLTLEVLRDVNDTPAEQYAQTVTDFRLEPEWDEYPGKYTPREVLSDPTYYTDYTETIADRSDERTLIGGVPAQWVRYRVEFKKPTAEVFAARVWTVFLLSPGDYWLLQLRGDERAWPASDSDLKRMVQSLQLLEPMLTRVKIARPAEPSKRLPSTLPEAKCPFGGTSFGMSVVLSCDWKVTGQWQGAADKDGRIGVERLEKSSPHQTLYVQHHAGSWSADEYSRNQELYLADKTKGAGEYNRTGKREIVVDGIPGTLISGWCSYSYDYTTTHNRILWKTSARYWGGSHGFRQLLTVSKGTDHFSIIFTSPETVDILEKLPASMQFFALHSQLPAGSSDSGATGSAGKPVPPTKNELDRLREDVRLLNDSGSHCRLGKALDASGDHAAAFNEFATAVQLNPRNPEADREIGRLYAAQNDLTRAIAAYQKVLFYSSNSDLDAHEQLARLYAKSGNSLFALFHVDNAAERADDVLLPADEIAPGWKALEDYMEQEKALDKSLSEDPVPQKLQDVLRLTELSMKYGDFAFANANCRIVHLIDHRNPRALACLAQTSEAAGEHDATVGYALDWLVLSPNNPEAYYWLAHGYFLEPADYVNAAESYEAVIRNAGQGQIAPAMLQEARATLPVCYQQVHDWQGAADAYDSAVRDSPSDAQILNNASWFYTTTEPSFRNPAKALEYGNRAVAIAPSNANVMDTLAEAYFANGRIDDAVATEQKALALDPEQADLQKQMEKFKQAQQSKQTQQPHNK